ncbi:MAG: copper-translocating P-type ATPase [Gemmatimonadetes bacterium]|nr:copper-translocating P-type ATPase [Gemmatimonadota bacterium]
MFRRRFLACLALSAPTLIWGHMLQSAFGYSAPAFPGSTWLPAMAGTLVFGIGGWPFLVGAYRELRGRLPGMMTLIALAVSVAFAFSLAVTLGYPGMPLWEELATLVTIMLLGHWVEMRSIAQASGALGELARLLPRTATRVRRAGADPEVMEEVALADVRPGNQLLVRPGSAVPADGTVRSGRSAVNESAITGESTPVDKVEGAKVIAGTVNGSGSLRIEVTGTGETTVLAGIMRLVSAAQTSRSRAQVLADRAAFWLTWVALGAGATTLAFWALSGAETSYAVERLVTTLVVACPHALGMAIPLVIANSTTLAARHGLLIRDRRGLEEARRVDTVVFDKTGTLTRGTFGVVEVVVDGTMTQDDALRIAAAVEGDSEHPIAAGIVRSARDRLLQIPRALLFESLPGRGVRADVDGTTYYVGGPALLAQLNVRPSASIETAIARAAGDGRARVVVVRERDGARDAVAAITIADVVRDESAPAVAGLKREGVRVVMLTGDAEAVAQAVGRQVGIDVVLAQVLPGDKAARIEGLQREGRRVLMVGDGVNDAPALVTADVGVAIGAGTDVAVEAGDVVLVRSDPRDVLRIIELSRATYRKMVQNLWWAAGYNVIAIPLAAGVLAPWGFLLSPAIAAVLMSASTIIVAANAQLLRRTRL